MPVPTNNNMAARSRIFLSKEYVFVFLSGSLITKPINKMINDDAKNMMPTANKNVPLRASVFSMIELMSFSFFIFKQTYKAYICGIHVNVTNV